MVFSFVCTLSCRFCWLTPLESLKMISTIFPKNILKLNYSTRTTFCQTFCMSRTFEVSFRKKICDKSIRVSSCFIQVKKWKSTNVSQDKDRIFTVPNLLCVGRIAVSPYLAASIINGDYKTSLIIYSLAGFTDLVSTTCKGLSKFFTPHRWLWCSFCAIKYTITRLN